MICRYIDIWSFFWLVTIFVLIVFVLILSYVVFLLCVFIEIFFVGILLGKGRDVVNLFVLVSRFVNNYFLGFFIYVILKVESVNNRIIRYLFW